MAGYKNDPGGLYAGLKRYGVCGIDEPVYPSPYITFVLLKILPG